MYTSKPGHVVALLTREKYARKMSGARMTWPWHGWGARGAQNVNVRTAVLTTMCCLAALPHGNANTKTSIFSERTITAVVQGRQRDCYVYKMDDATTKQAVYWGQPKLYVRLEPCTGMPHLQVSVYGCPSEGHQVNWEFQDQLMRNDLLTMGRKVPLQWEWPGDLETLSIDATHKTFYIEVSQYLRKVRTPGEHTDLERQLRAAGFTAEADIVKQEGDRLVTSPLDIIKKGAISSKLPNTTETKFKVDASLYQDLILPQSEYKLTVILYDEKRVPKDKLLPMTNRMGFERDIDFMPPDQRPLQFIDDPQAGHYVCWRMLAYAEVC